MRFVTVLVALVFALSAASVYAQGRGNGQAKRTTVSTTKAKSTQTPKQTAKQTRKAETRAVKAEKRVVKAETRAAKTETKAARLNPEQETRLLARLPAGMTVQDASHGFKNWGQFVAAANASNSHNISFVELKARMTGIPIGGTEPTMTPMSLGQALQSFKTTAPTP